MSSNFTHVRIVTNSRRRICDLCETSIPIGEKYAYYVGKLEGDFMVCGHCMKCYRESKKQEAEDIAFCERIAK